MPSYDHDDGCLAETYDKISDFQFDGGKHLVDRLEVKTGYRVLDVGCGTGRLACWIQECVGTNGAVVGIDPLEERIAIARRRNRQIEFLVGNAENLHVFPDASFDAVCLSAVFHWIKDKPKALAEIFRVLRPGGRLGCTTAPKELYWLGTMPIVCASVMSRAPYLESIKPSILDGIQQYLTTTEVVHLLTEHQFELIDLHIVQRMLMFSSGKEVIDFAESSSFGNLLGLVSEDLRPSLRAHLTEAFDKNRKENGITLRMFATLFTALRNE